MKPKYVIPLAILVLSARSVAAVMMYQQDFNSVASSSSTVTGIEGYGQIGDIGGTGWQIQGGNGAGTSSLMAGINANGVGGSQAVFGTWDTSASSGFSWAQYTQYGVGAAGAQGTLANINISLDLFMSGSSTNNPISIMALQNDANTELSFTPTLSDGQYTSVSFSLAEATAGGTGAAFDPTAGFWLRITHGNGGFGFDADNTVQIDNVLIQSIPEPSSLGLAGLGAAMLMGRRRRRL